MSLLSLPRKVAGLALDLALDLVLGPEESTTRPCTDPVTCPRCKRTVTDE